MTTHIAGRQLRAARVALGLTLKDLAELAGLAEATVSKVEAGGIGCRSGTINAVVAVLELRGARFFASGVSFPPDRMELR